MTPNSFDTPTAKRFVGMYNNAKSMSKTQFDFGNSKVDVSYAKYLIEYLEQQGIVNGTFDLDNYFNLKNTQK